MENPSSWNRVIKLIADTMATHEKEMREQPPVCGVSVYVKIYQALEKAEFLKEDAGQE